MNHTPRVSVIIPTRSNRRYLEEALNSVLEQTYRDFEIIVVDDASEIPVEDTLQVQSEKIRIIRLETNKGVSGARNTAATVAKGEFVAQIDDDDVWLPGYLEKSVAVFDTDKDIGMTGSYIAEFNESTGQILRPVWRGPVGYMTDSDIFKYSWPRPSGVIFRTKCFRDVGGYDESFKGYEDADIYFRMAQKFGCYFINEELVHYRIHSSNTSQKELMMGLEGVKFWSSLIKRGVSGVPIKLLNMRLARQHYRVAREYAMIDEFRNSFENMKKATQLCPWVGITYLKVPGSIFKKVELCLKPYIALIALSLACTPIGISLRSWLKPKEFRNVTS